MLLRIILVCIRTADDEAEYPTSSKAPATRVPIPLLVALTSEAIEPIAEVERDAAAAVATPRPCAGTPDDVFESKRCRERGDEAEGAGREGPSASLGGAADLAPATDQVSGAGNGATACNHRKWRKRHKAYAWRLCCSSYTSPETDKD